MRQNFINYACEKLNDVYSKEEIIDKLSNKELEFDILSFNELILEHFDEVVAICPDCGNAIWRGNGDYNYETGYCVYECEYCGCEVNVG